MNTTKEQYKRFLFTYGLLSILFVLKEFELQENFEECQKITDCIRELEKKLNCQLFTEINPECIDDLIRTFEECNLTGDGLFENSKHYSTIILDEINEMK